MIERRAHGRWKGILYDYDALLAVDDTQECLYCLNDRDVQLILAALDTYAWRTRYQSPSETPIDQPTIDAWQGHLGEAVMTCVSGGSVQLRQNPDNSCQLQQSSDGGETWTLAFDFAICVPPAQQTILDTVLNNNAYVPPFTPNATFSSQAGYNDTQKQAGYLALCYACQMLTEGLAQTALHTKQGDVIAEGASAVALAVAAFLVAAFDVMTFGFLTPLCVAIAALILEVQASIDALDLGVWTNTDNLATLSCLALSNLTNLPVSLANFQLAYTGADCLTSDQQAMATIFTAILSNIAVAAQLESAWLANVGQANAASQAGVTLADCGCSDETWCYVWNFASGNLGIWELSCGTLDSTGVKAATECGGWPSISRVIGRFYLPTDTAVTSVKLFYSYPAYRTSFTAIMVFDWDGAQTEVHESVNPPCPSTFTDSYLVGDGSKAWGCYYVDDADGEEFWLTGIEITGTGTNPFGGSCNCISDPLCG